MGLRISNRSSGTGRQTAPFRYVALGDSITKGADIGGSLEAGGWPTLLGATLGNGLRMYRNAGIGGDTAADMIDRFPADVAPYRPDIVSILAGTNDINAGRSDEAFQADIESLVVLTRQLDALPCLATIPPKDSSTAGETARLLRWNRWLRTYAADNGLPLFDFFKVLVDPATESDYITGFSTDGTHPNRIAFPAMANEAASALSGIVPANGSRWPRAATNEAGDNLLLNALALDDTAGVPDSWPRFSGDAARLSVVSGSPDAVGRMIRLEALTASTVSVRQTVNADPGHRLMFCGIVRTTSDGRAWIYTQSNGTPNTFGTPWYVETNPGVYRFCVGPFTVPDDATTVSFLLRQNVAIDTEGHSDWGELALYDLTAMGIDEL